MNNDQSFYEKIRASILEASEAQEKGKIIPDLNYKDILQIIDNLHSCQTQLLNNLQISESNLREIFNSTEDAIFIEDANTSQIIDLNNRTLEIYNYNNKEEILSGGIGSLSANIYPYTKEKAKEYIYKTINEGPQTFNWLAKKKSGEAFWITKSLKKSKIDGKDRIIALVKDISEQKKIEKAILESEERYRTVVSSSREGIILQSSNGEILTWNQAAEQIFGIKAEDAIGETSFSRNYNIYKEDGSECKGEEHPSMITLQTGKPCTDVLLKVIRNKDEYSWIKVNTNPVFTDNDNNPSYVVISFSDITTLKETEEKLKLTEQKVSAKLNAILMPEGDISQLELIDIIDAKEIQKLMDDFYKLTQIGMGIIDLKGNILVKTGWQEICTDFHRKNIESCKSCIESDFTLTKNIEPGTFKIYKCKNNMWDIATPIMLAGKHIGNLFLGQFLFDNEIPDIRLFENQAKLYNFDEKSYLSALNKVPRWNKETINNVMSFYIHFANMISSLSYSNIKLAQIIAENERTNQKLHDREEIFSTIVNQANDAIGLIDTETADFFEFNNSAHIMLGYTREEFSKLTLFDIEAALSKEKLLESLSNITELGERIFETQHLHKDGSIKDIRVSTKLVNIRGKNYIAGIWSDITERKKQEALLKEKDLIFQSLLDNSPIYVFFKDHNIKAIHLSKNFEQMLGMPVEDAIGKDMNELFPSELALSMIEDDKKILNDGKLVQVEEELNGHYYSTIKFPIHRENVRPMLAGFTLDITDKKLAEIALQQSEARLSAFMKYIPALILIKDHEFRTVFGNEQFSELFPLDEWIGKTPSELFPSNVAVIMIEKDKEAIEKGYISYEEIWSDKKGLDHVYYTQKFRIDVPNAEPFIGAVITDITDRKKAEQQIKDLNLHLEKRVEERTAELTIANKELEAFAYTVSHDLRAPLRAIDGFTNILKEDYQNLFDDKGKKICKTISDNAKKMGQLIDDLLSFSRYGRNELSFSSFDMETLIKYICQDIISDETRNKIQLKINEMPIVMGDRSMYRQVWANLISNAVKFSSKEEKSYIEIGCKIEDNEYIFSIKDNGTGFDMKYYNKLFGVFQRLHNNTDFEGTGVGLAIVQRIIHRHGGRIWANSELGKGSDFYFTVKK